MGSGRLCLCEVPLEGVSCAPWPSDSRSCINAQAEKQIIITTCLPLQLSGLPTSLARCKLPVSPALAHIRTHSYELCKILDPKQALATQLPSEIPVLAQGLEVCGMGCGCLLAC